MFSVSSVLIILSAILGGIAASPIITIARRLLTTVLPQDAAPIMYIDSQAQNLSNDQNLIPLTISSQWQQAFQWTLIILLPVSTWWSLTIRPQSGLLQASLLWIAIISLLMVALLDAATHLVFREMLYPSGLLFIAVGLFTGHLSSQLIGAFAGGGVMAILFLVGKMVYGTDVLGAGDIELGIWFGLLLGWPGVFAAYIKAMLIMIIGLSVLLATRKIAMASYIPIGAFLCLGVIAQIFFAGSILV